MQLRCFEPSECQCGEEQITSTCLQWEQKWESVTVLFLSDFFCFGLVVVVVLIMSMLLCTKKYKKQIKQYLGKQTNSRHQHLVVLIERYWCHQICARLQKTT